MNVSLFYIRSIKVAHGHACIIHSVIQPNIEYSVRLVFVISLKIIHKNIGAYGKAPDVAFPGTIWVHIIDLIDPPVIFLAIVEKTFRVIGSILCLMENKYTTRIIYGRLVNIFKRGSKIQIMFDSKKSRLPLKNHISCHFCYLVLWLGGLGKLRITSGIKHNTLDVLFRQCRVI